MQMIQEGIYANAPEKPLKMIGSPQAILKAKVSRLIRLITLMKIFTCSISLWLFE